MDKFLSCHTSKEPFFTKGTLYKIIDEEEKVLFIKADDGKLHKLTKEPDYDGLSYASFMTLDYVRVT